MDWKAYAQRCEAHALVLAEQCEALQVENDHLEAQIDNLKEDLKVLQDSKD